MQNLNQQNSQLYICIPQVNTLGHPSEGPTLDTSPKYCLAETKQEPGPWPKLPHKRMLHGLFRPYFEAKHRGQCGKGDPVWVRDPWAPLSVFPSHVPPDTFQAGPHHT